MKIIKWKKKNTNCILQIADDCHLNVKGLIKDLKKLPTLEEYKKL